MPRGPLMVVMNFVAGIQIMWGVRRDKYFVIILLPSTQCLLFDKLNQKSEVMEPFDAVSIWVGRKMVERGAGNIQHTHYYLLY